MSDIAIRVENLGKQYRIGALQKNGGRFTYKTLRDSIAGAASAPLRAVRVLMGRNGAAKEHEDNTIWALKDVSFDVKHGEIVGVIGRNGAGKSTLLKILSRITEPTTGRVEIHGRIGSLLEVGTGFHPELTGRDNVYLNGAILGMKRAEITRQFDEIVAFAEVEKFIDTPVKHYSSGMHLRLAFAVAAHLEPEILIVDEVLAVGDASFQKKCLGKMQDVSRAGRTVLFVSHNLLAIQMLCSRGLLLNQGVLALDDNAVSAIEQHQRDSKETALLFGREVDLGGLKRWGGSGKARLVSVHVYAPESFDREERPVRQGQVGFALSVCGDLSAVKAAAVTIYDLYDRKIVNCNTLQLRRALCLDDKRDTICIVVHDLRLRPGTYKVGLWLGGSEAQHIDVIAEGLSLEILPAAELQWISEHEGVYECPFDFRVASRSTWEVDMSNDYG